MLPDASFSREATAEGGGINIIGLSLDLFLFLFIILFIILSLKVSRESDILP